MVKPCFKRYFTVKFTLYTLLTHEHSVQLCFVSVSTLMLIRPVTMNNPLVQENFMEMSKFIEKPCFILEIALILVA